MSNTERQRQFRERNPGYYGRLHRKRNAGIKAMLAQQKAEAAARIQTEIKAQLEVEAQARAVLENLQRVPLMLPPGGPVIDSLAIEIAALSEARKARASVVCEC